MYCNWVQNDCLVHYVSDFCVDQWDALMDIKKYIDFLKINKLQNFSDTMIALGLFLSAIWLIRAVYPVFSKK